VTARRRVFKTVFWIPYLLLIFGKGNISCFFMKIDLFKCMLSCRRNALLVKFIPENQTLTYCTKSSSATKLFYFCEEQATNFISIAFRHPYTVKRVDEVVRHPHLVTQDQNTQVSNKVFDIPEENFTINIELFRHFSQVSN